MRIAHITDPGLDPRQVEAVRQLIAAQAAQRHHPFLVSSTEIGPPDSPDVIHTHGRTIEGMKRGLASLQGNPARLHTFWENPLRAPGGLIERFGLARAGWMSSMDTLIALSEADRLELASVRYAPFEKLVHIPPALELEPYRRAKQSRGVVRALLGIGESDFVVGMSAPLTLAKNQVELLEAARILIEDRPDIRFVLAGEGPLREPLLQKASHLHIAANVYVLSEPVNAVQFQADIDLYACTSSDETFHLPFLEAFAAGNTAVGSDIGAGYELRGMGNPIGVYPLGSVKDLVLAIQDIHGHRDLYATLAREQKDIAIRTYHPHRLAERLEAAYRAAICGKNQAPTAAGLRAGG